MNKDNAPTPSHTTYSEPPGSGWKAAVKRLAIAGAFFVTAFVAIATLLSHINPSLLSRALTTFFGWPLAAQALVLVGVLIVTGVFASGKQIYQGVLNRQAQENTRIAVTQAILDTTKDDAQAIRSIVEEHVPDISKAIADIYRFLVGMVFGGTLSSSKTPLPRQTVDSAPPQPVVLLSQIIAKPQDDVQFAPPTHLIGRETELRRLEEQLSSHRRDRDITVISGISGIGKTALAATAIERIKEANSRIAEPDIASSVHGAIDTQARKHFVDGFALLQCTGLLDPVDIVRQALERVDPKRRLPASLDLNTLQQISEELLAGKDVLIVLDGVQPHIPLGAVVRALRTEKRSAHILITTTVAPSVNIAPVESQLHLEALTVVTNEDGTVTDEALELFANYAGKGSAKDFGERLDSATAIVEALERHTYALQLMGAYVRDQPDILRGVAAEVKRLDAGLVSPGLEDILKPVWVAMTTVVNHLPQDSQTLLFAFVAACGRTEMGRRATRALGQKLELHHVDAAIHTLVTRELMKGFETETMLEGSDRHRLRIHTLLHGYISQQLDDPEREAVRKQARNVITDFYASYITQYDRRGPSRETQRALSPDAINITHALEWAISNNQHADVVALAHGMRRFWHDRWLNEMSLRYLLTAVASATLLADRAREAKDKSDERTQRGYAADLAFTLGRVYRRVGRLAEAEPLFLQDLHFRKQTHQYAAQAEALHQLAQLERTRGRMKTALKHCRRGLAIVRLHVPRRGGYATQGTRDLLQAKGVLIAQKGRILRLQGYLREADRLFDEAFTLFVQTGDLLEQGVALGYRGRIARVLGCLRDAQEYFEQSNNLARQVFDFRGQGVIATQLGRIARIQGNTLYARKAFEEGLNKARQVLDHQAEVVNLNYLGRIENSAGDTLKAEGLFTQSLLLAREIGDRHNEGVNLGYLGRIARKRNFLPQAQAYFSDSLTILREVEDRRGQALILGQLALVDLEFHHYARAQWRLWRSMHLIGKIGDRRSEGTILLFRGQLDVARGDRTAARTHFAAALERTQESGDVGGEAEALDWLNKVTETSGAAAKPEHGGA